MSKKHQVHNLVILDESGQWIINVKVLQPQVPRDELKEVIRQMNIIYS